MSTIKAKRRNGCLGRTVLALFVFTGLSVEVPASADEHPPDSAAPTDSATPDVDINEIGTLGGLYIRGDDPGRVTPAPVLTTRMTGEINGLVARFTVRHAFANPGDDWVEGIYVFPLPNKAAVDHLRMETGDRVIEPGSPWENGYVESFNGKLRDELLDREIFYTLTEAKILIERCRRQVTVEYTPCFWSRRADSNR